MVDMMMMMMMTERWWQGVSVGEVEPTTKVINATRCVWNFQKRAWNVGEFYFGGLIISYHIMCKIYSAPITLYKTMGALHSS